MQGNSAITNTVSTDSEGSSSNETQDSSQLSKEKELLNAVEAQVTEQAYHVLTTVYACVREFYSRDGFDEDNLSTMIEKGEQIRLILEENQSERIQRIAHCVNAAAELYKNLGSFDSSVHGNEIVPMGQQIGNIVEFETFELLLKPIIQLWPVFLFHSNLENEMMSHNEDRLD